MNTFFCCLCATDLTAYPLKVGQKGGPPRPAGMRVIDAIRNERIAPEPTRNLTSWPGRDSSIAALQRAAEHVELESFLPGVCHRAKYANANPGRLFNCSTRNGFKRTTHCLNSLQRKSRPCYTVSADAIPCSMRRVRG